MPEPMSRNCRTPCATRNRTARRRNARLARIVSPMFGVIAEIMPASSRSTAKLCAPPRK
jgi:hypothetical protein